MERWSWWLMFCIVGVVGVHTGQAVQDMAFDQVEPTRFTFQGTPTVADWGVAPVTNVQQLARVSGGGSTALVLASDALYLFYPPNAMWTPLHAALGLNITQGMRVASVPASSRDGLQLWIAGASGVWWCHSTVIPPAHHALPPRVTASTCTFAAAPLGSVYDVASGDGKVWLATENGLFVASNPSTASETPSPPIRVAAVDITPVYSVAVDLTSGSIAAGTFAELFVSRDGGQTFFFFFCGFASVGGDVDGNVTSLAFDTYNNLWIGTPLRVQVLSLKKMTIIPLGGQQGLPQGNLTCASSDGIHADIWLGTRHGLIRHQTADPLALPWSYFNGPRWLPGLSVSAVLRLDGGALVATESGITHLALTQWTLGKKARHYQSLIYPRHDRYGLVADSPLSSFGDLRTFHMKDSDNDGLWTSIYLASQVFRYAVTGDPEAKRNVWKHFTAMEFLKSVTGVPGLMARSIVKKGESYGPGGQWHNSTVFPGWIWKGDTSSDEVTGHLFVYPLVLDLVAHTQEEKDRVRQLIDNITSTIVENGFYLLDLDGKPTKWGQWAPEVLNAGLVGYRDDRGLNSLEIVSWLVSAYRITNDDRYLKALQFLVTTNGYDINLVNTKMLYPPDINYSDDELIFLPYYTYFYAYERMSKEQKAALPENLHERMGDSIRRTWDTIIDRENASLWSVIYYMSGQYPHDKGFGLAGALSTLRQWPLDQINWPVENAHRLDVTLDPALSRAGRTQSLNLLSYAERAFMRWNSSPFSLGGGNGYSEYDPSAWLLPYWMLIYHGLLDPPS